MTLKHHVKFRVYQRAPEHTAFLWDIQSLTEEQRKNTSIVFSDLDESEETEVKFKLAVPREIQEAGLPQTLAMGIVNHEENKLDSAEPYFAKLVIEDLSGMDIIVEKLKVLPAGILPATECDNKFRNVHLYGFNTKLNKWQKCEGKVDKKGRFRILVDQDTDSD